MIVSVVRCCVIHPKNIVGLKWWLISHKSGNLLGFMGQFCWACLGSLLSLVVGGKPRRTEGLAPLVMFAGGAVAWSNLDCSCQLASAHGTCYSGPLRPVALRPHPHGSVLVHAPSSLEGSLRGGLAVHQSLGKYWFTELTQNFQILTALYNMEVV